ncbi:FAA hydrolase family protein [Filobacillus milosensis]|uniref:FAA hydrolase family protein n=1 Tax=Filobacillus milosensis TaxID=94137 RepID=A0A4Y8IRP2_9BACI|nr:fumarylacetoacetate hydrolase family protein [Filobacillus milosensis]TFB24443.1 FAA hydrolase family protein [Filobacillus milosensis]
MKLLSFRYRETEYWGVKYEEGIYYSDQLMTHFPTLLSVIENYDHLNLKKDLNKFVESESIEILPPIYPKKNIMCIGKNYKAHAYEMTTHNPDSVPEYPVVFTKSPNSIIAHEKNIMAHANFTSQLDYEGELAVVIGKLGKDIKREEAQDYIFGYTILNDVTARDLQKKHQQFYRGKSLDTFAPLGPYIMTKDHIEDPQNLKVQTYVNDELRQNGNTKEMIFPIDELIEALSEGTTLEPGDIIATGTPSGVGKGFNPPKFLKSGDTIKISIEGIGELVNQVK